MTSYIHTPQQFTASTYAALQSHERIEEKSQEAAVQNSRVPPPMQRLSLGKYKIPGGYRRCLSAVER